MLLERSIAWTHLIYVNVSLLKLLCLCTALVDLDPLYPSLVLFAHFRYHDFPCHLFPHGSGSVVFSLLLTSHITYLLRYYGTARLANCFWVGHSTHRNAQTGSALSMVNHQTTSLNMLREQPASFSASPPPLFPRTQTRVDHEVE